MLFFQRQVLDDNGILEVGKTLDVEVGGVREEEW